MLNTVPRLRELAQTKFFNIIHLISSRSTSFAQNRLSKSVRLLPRLQVRKEGYHMNLEHLGPLLLVQALH